jgi:hypothetical protein
VQQRFGQAEALLVAVGQRSGAAIGIVGQRQPVDRLVDGLALNPWAQSAYNFQVLAHREFRISVGAFNQIPDRCPWLAFTGADALPQHPHLARRRRNHAQQQANCGCFAGAVETQERVNLAARDSEGDVIDGGDSAVAFYQSFCLDGFVHAAVPAVGVLAPQDLTAPKINKRTYAVFTHSPVAALLIAASSSNWQRAPSARVGVIGSPAATARTNCCVMRPSLRKVSSHVSIT